MRLPVDEHAAAEARRFARSWAAYQALSGRLVDDLELVVAELVSNAIRYGAPPYEVELSASDGVIRGEVRDGSRTPPRPTSHRDERGGFGLGIVEACTTRWGTEVVATGKQVWFEVKP